MRLERSHFLWKNAIQVEKSIVEEMGYKIDKKMYTVDVSLQNLAINDAAPTHQYIFKKYLK